MLGQRDGPHMHGNLVSLNADAAGGLTSGFDASDGLLCVSIDCLNCVTSGTITSMRRVIRWAGWNNDDDVCTREWMGG
jgi:hypothetical protein